MLTPGRDEAPPLPVDIWLQHPLLSLGGPVRVLRRQCVPIRRRKLSPVEQQQKEQQIQAAIAAAEQMCSIMMPAAHAVVEWRQRPGLVSPSELMECHDGTPRPRPRLMQACVLTHPTWFFIVNVAALLCV